MTEFASSADRVLPTLRTDVAGSQLLAYDIAPGGTPLGADPAGERFSIDLVRATPTRATLVCLDPWLVRVIVLRLAAFGVAAVIATDRPAPWNYLINRVGGSTPIAAIRTEHTQPLPAPSIARPLVIVEDARDIPAETYAPRMSWQTTLYVRASARESARASMDGSDVILVSRVDGGTAEAVAAATGADARAMEALGPREILAIVDGRVQRVLVSPTTAERWLG